MNKEQILALAENADETATQYLQCAGEYHPDYHSVRDDHFYHAAIKSYKAELLKEAGEPIYVEGTCEIQNWKWIRLAVDQANEYERWGWKIRKLFTSDQVAAAITKATKPLKDQLAAAQELIAVLRKDAETYGPEKISLQKQAWLEADRQRQINDLKDQLAAAQEEIESNKAYFTTLLEEQRVQLAKAEQRVAEWQPIETAPKDGAAIVVIRTHNKCYRTSVQFYDDQWCDTQEVNHDDLMENAATHWMPLPKAPNGASS